MIPAEFSDAAPLREGRTFCFFFWFATQETTIIINGETGGVWVGNKDGGLARWIFHAAIFAASVSIVHVPV